MTGELTSRKIFEEFVLKHTEIIHCRGADERESGAAFRSPLFSPFSSFFDVRFCATQLEFSSAMNHGFE